MSRPRRKAVLAILQVDGTDDNVKLIADLQEGLENDHDTPAHVQLLATAEKLGVGMNKLTNAMGTIARIQ